MSSWALTLPLIGLAFLLLALLPDRWANRRPGFLALGIQVWCALACVLGLALAVGTHGQSHFVPLGWESGLSLGGFLLDGLSLLMFCLVAYLGAIVSRFSVSYLAGEPTQGRFFKWLGFTLGAVLTMILAGNLALFVGAWIASSLGLHQLLTHYPERKAGLRAARTKFLISRLGDGLLIAALLATFLVYGTWNFPELFQRMESNSAEASNWVVAAIGFLLVLGAMTKSAQFPFHGWLPETMETPTPVSAFMHAGIINAGGYLVLRLSPILAHAPAALDFLTLIGGFTALFGAAVMMTQTAVKRSLAFSTISQMGFMMFQCGMGAFTAALVHIFAHSLYKAHAFLSSGSVLERMAGTRGGRARVQTPWAHWACLALGSLLAVGCILSIDWALEWKAWSKAGALALNLILFLAMSNLLFRALLTQSPITLAWAVTSALALVSLFRATYFLIEVATMTGLPSQPIVMSTLDMAILGLVLTGFVLLHLFQAILGSWKSNKTLVWLYCQASHGFHLDIPAARLARNVWPVKS